MATVHVLSPGLLTSVQDEGRRATEHLGIMVGGAADDFAAAWANRLLGNRLDAAVLEVTLLGPTLEAREEGSVSLAGADLGASVDGETWPPGTVRHLHPGSIVRFSAPRFGVRAYIGFRGGLDVPQVLGSRSTDLVAGFGGLDGRPLHAGDVLAFSDGRAPSVTAPTPTCLIRHILRVLPGVRLDRFDPSVLSALVREAFTVSPLSDRVGIRLGGAKLPTLPQGDAVSEGMAIGSVEIPPGGEPLILMKSRGTIGGYATLAHVIQADLPALAQLAPGDQVRFQLVTPQTALEALREMRRLLQLAPKPLEDDAARAKKAEVAGEVVVVRSPSWCTVYRSARPGLAPLAQEGEHVAAGDPLAVIEVMKAFSELRSPVAGIVRQISFGDGEVVEEGRPLVTIAREEDSLEG